MRGATCIWLVAHPGALRLAEGRELETRREQLLSLVHVLDGKADPLAVATVWGRMSSCNWCTGFATG
jgi:hypothetical protein